MSSLVHCIAVLFFLLWGVQTISPTPACPAPCLCEKTSLFNCASLGLSTIPFYIPATATSLDLSNNSLLSFAPLGSGHVYLPRLQHFWVGNNSLESLSLCLGRGLESVWSLTRRNRRCVSWAPGLQLLSAERNQLTYLPRGLGSVKYLQVLKLSHNRIPELGPADLIGCTQLSEVYLQHNLITTIHPQAFKDLQKLQVLNLSYNLLTIIPLPAYLSLRNLNALVDVSDNKWRCDCNLKMIQRWLSFDSESGSQTWKVVCSSPSYHSGKDLLSLNELDLACPRPVSNTHTVNTMTVDEGMELSLPCTDANQDLTEAHWWTPSGQVSGSQQFLHISNITEQHAGLYICASGFNQEHVSVFNLHVRKKIHHTRLRREAQNVLHKLGEEKVNTLNNVPTVRAVTQSNFALAVSLSVLITFIVAFVLGVILRPFLDKLCIKIKRKRHSTSSSNQRSASMVPRPYVNEAFESCDQIQEVHRGSRVSFGGVTEVQIERDEQYDVIVEDNQSATQSAEVNTDDNVFYEKVQRNECSVEMGEVHTNVPLRKTSEKMSEFEHIPDPDEMMKAEEESISSSCSSEHGVVQYSYEVNAIEQSVDCPTTSTHSDTIIEFTNDPFSAFPKLKKDELDPDLWNDSGESFSFTEGSPRQSSPVLQAVYDYSSFKKEMSVDEESDAPSSSKSSESGESEGYPTEYTVNPEKDEESETSSDIHYSENRKLYSYEQDVITEKQTAGTRVPFRQETVTLDPDRHITFNHRDSFDDVQITERKESRRFNISIDYEDEPLQYRVHPVYRSSQEVNRIWRTNTSDTSSFSENEYNEADYYPRRLEIKSEHDISSIGSTPIKTGMVLNINHDNTSSSTDIEEKGKQRERRTFKGLSALLFNRSGTETNRKPVQSPSKPTYTDSKSLVGSLGLYFKRQPTPPEEHDTPTTDDDDSIFALVEQAIDKVPKLKKRLLFTVADHQPSSPHEPTPRVEATFNSEVFPESSSMEDTFFEKIGEVLHPIPQVKRYLNFSSVSYLEAPTTAEEKVIHKTETIRKSSSSSESDSSAIIKEDDFFASCDYLPKEKRHLQFLLSDNSRPVSGIQTESRKPSVKFENDPSISDTDDFFGQFTFSLDKIPKVKRCIHFQIAPFPMAHAPSKLNTLEVMPVLKNTEMRYSSESEYLPSENTEATMQLGREVEGHNSSFEDDELVADGNNFFQKIGLYLDALPKIRRYLLFTAPPLEEPPFLSLNSQTTLKTTTKPEFSSSVAVKPDITEDIFFEQIGPCVSSLPKVKRYIEFTHSDSHSPSSVKQTVTPVGNMKLPWKRPSYSSDDDTNSSTSQDNFFEGMRISRDNSWKLKRYLQFVQSEPQLATHQFPSLNTEMTEKEITLETTTKPEFWSSGLVAVKPDMSKDIFFEQIGPCYGSLPKVKRYIEFIPSDSHSPSSVKQTVTPVGNMKLPWKRQGYSSDEETNSGTSQDNFFEGMRISRGNSWKLKRSLHFVQFESQLSNHQFPSLNTEMTEKEITLETTTKPEFWSSGLVAVKPDMREDIFFEKIGPCHGSLPKVKRYIEFIPSDSHSPTSVKQTVTPVGNMKLPWKRPSYSSDDDTNSSTSQKGEYFEGISETSPSIDVMPKVKKYIQILPSEVDPPSQSSVNTGDIIMEPRKSIVSTENMRPTTKGDNLPENVGVSVNRIPKYLKFNSPSPFSKTEITPQLATTVNSRNINSSDSSEEELNPDIKSNNFFTQIDSSHNEMPKIKRYSQFRMSEPQSLTHTQTVSDEHNHFDKVTSSTSKDNFFERIGASLDNLPKVKRSLHFAQSEPWIFNPTPSPSSGADPKLNHVQAEPFYSTQVTSMTFEENLRPVTDRDNVSSMYDRIQRLKQSLTFTNFDPNDRNRTHVPSAMHDSLPATNVTTQARALNPITRPGKPLLFTRSDADMQFGDPFSSPETGLRQKASMSLPGDKKRSNSSDSNSETELSSSKYDTTLELKSNLGDSAAVFTYSSDHAFAHSDSLPKQRRYVVTNTELQDSISDSIPGSSGGNDAKDYLRDSSVARQRQERRRMMFQQKKRAMDGFSLSSRSFSSQDDDQEPSSSAPSFSEHIHSRVTTQTSDKANHIDTAASEYEHLSEKTLTSLRSKITGSPSNNKRSDV